MIISRKMPIYNLTQDKIDEFEKLFQEKKKCLPDTDGKNNIQLWREDLDDISKIFNTPVKKIFNVKKKN